MVVYEVCVLFFDEYHNYRDFTYLFGEQKEAKEFASLISNNIRTVLAREIKEILKVEITEKPILNSEFIKDINEKIVEVIERN